MSATAKLFRHGDGQAVCLPEEFLMIHRHSLICANSSTDVLP
jgi:virulence-associated protein VagC